MCYQCWQKNGAPQIVNQKVKRAVELITDLYDESLTGGLLHVQVDDYNLGDHFFTEDAMQPAADLFEREPTPTEQALFDLMRGMSEPERYSAVALNDGFFEA